LELFLGEGAHRAVCLAESVDLGEEVGEAGWVGLANLLKGFLVESCGCERLARVLKRRKGIGRPGGLREPADELDRGLVQVPGRLVSVREALSDEDRGALAEDAADLVGSDFQIRDVVNDEGEPGGACRFIWQRQSACISFKRLGRRCPRNLIPHRGCRLDGEDVEVEPVTESSGELAGPRADVHQGHPLRWTQVTSYRLAPLREPVAWHLAGRLVRRSCGRVIADPGDPRLIADVLCVVEVGLREMQG
jgi:hypothetical protein